MTDQTIVSPAAFEAVLDEVAELKRARYVAESRLEEALARVANLERLVTTLTGGGDGG